MEFRYPLKRQETIKIKIPLIKPLKYLIANYYTNANEEDIKKEQEICKKYINRLKVQEIPYKIVKKEISKWCKESLKRPYHKHDWYINIDSYMYPHFFIHCLKCQF
jgi:hypothetical protein